ncbi:hypothetical protein A2U01_0115575, partial [Trifolium medium]|nr:hypothetical protein [Trifolium medium]
EVTVGSDKQKDSATIAIENVVKVDEVAHPQSDEGLKAGTDTVNIERFDEQNKDTDVDAIDVDNLTSG